MNTPLKTLILKLNRTCRAAAERAAALTMQRGHFEVDVEHLLLALLEAAHTDLPLLLARLDVPVTAVRREIESELSTLPHGNTRTPVFSARMGPWLEQAWLLASLDGGSASIRGAHLLLALLTEPRLSQMVGRGQPSLARLPLDRLKHQLTELTLGSEEATRAAAVAGARPEGPDDGATADQVASPSGGKALAQYTIDLTGRAREGRLDPVIGRDDEIRQVVDILMRRRQNNPILTGEAGVGKTAVVEGLALRIVSGDVPPPLQGVALHVLDLGLLQAGASVKGEFESRLKSVIDEVRQSPHPIILFIDEAHALIGAGGAAGQGDAANLLKPALARGELRTIAATTWGEFKKYFEKDAALARRFQVVKVEEPSEELACAMLRGMAPLMQKHFGVRVLDEALVEAVRLSTRYLSGRQLPDKAISVLDTACAQVALGQAATPAALETCRRALERNEAEALALQSERAEGRDHEARLQALAAQREALTAELQTLQARQADEAARVADIVARRRELSAATTPDPSQQEALRALEAELAQCQGHQPLVPLQVDRQVVAGIVAAWTGVPLGQMVRDDLQTVLALERVLGERVVGQDHALAAVAQRIRTSRARLEDPHKPQGVFLFVGPSGVGKTETALALASALYGGERKLVTLNMSEYQEAHSVAGLKGSPPGYVGYGEGGLLTEAVRRQPHCVLLLDEVEKAHPDVLELFFQVFDKGVLDDAEGRTIDFRHTLIILTSNVGSAQIMQACLNKPAQERPKPAELAEMLRPALYRTFKPAFIGRLAVVPFLPVDDDVLERIIRLKLDRIGARVAAQHQARFEYDRKLVEAVLARCTEVDTGARNVDHILDGTLLPELASRVLARMAEGQRIERVRVTTGKSGEFRLAVA